MHTFFNRTLFLMVLIIGVFVYGCTEDAPLSEYDTAGTETFLVVDAQMSTDTIAHLVTLHKSLPVGSTQAFPAFSNALVSITDSNHTVYTLHESSTTPGTYLTDSTVYGQIGHVYTLNISNVDLYGDGKTESFNATSNIIKINPIDSIKVLYTLGLNGKGMWMIYLYAQDIGGGLHYYLPKIYKNHILMNDSANMLGPADNTSFNGKYFDGFTVGALYESDPKEIVNPGDTITLELDGITQGYDQFLTGLLLNYNPKIPIFSGPNANAPTNINPQNITAGYFATYSVQRKSIIYWPPAP